jgi:hypothetical protein
MMIGCAQPRPSPRMKESVMRSGTLEKTGKRM